MMIDVILNDFLERAELDEEVCNLKHSDDDSGEGHHAIDYLCQPLGHIESGAVYDMIRIPICAECVDTLYSNEWILFYCLECTSSQWLYRAWAKRKYADETRVIWLSKCPICVVEES